MAITRVGNGSQSATAAGENVASLAPVFPGNVTSGSLLVVLGGYSNWAGSGQTVGVTDSRGTTYTVLHSTEETWLSGWNHAFIAYGTAPSGGANTVTVTPSPGNFWAHVVIDEFAGSAALVLDVDGGESTGTSTTPSDALTTLTAGSLILAAVLHNDVSSVGGAYGDGYTGLYADPTIQHVPSAFEFKIGGAAGNEAPDFTIGASVAWRVKTLAFKEESAGADGFIPFTRDRLLAQMLAQ